MPEAVAEGRPESGAGHVPWLALQLAVSGAVAGVVLAVEGLDGVAAWNLVPLLLAVGSLAVVRGTLGSPQVRVAGTVFWATQVLLGLAVHVAWYLDLGQISSGSSTAGLIFVVIPVYSVVLGLLLAGVSIGACLVHRKMRGA